MYIYRENQCAQTLLKQESLLQNEGFRPKSSFCKVPQGFNILSTRQLDLVALYLLFDGASHSLS